MTVQNHGGYDNPDTIELLEDFSGLDDYITARVFFGDHQPVLETEAEDILFDGSKDRLIKYNTPLLIWKNYDNTFEDIGDVSANYLPLLILKQANYPLTPFLKTMEKAFAQFPVLTNRGIVDASGMYYKDLSEVNDPEGVLTDYWMLEYNNLFDKTRLDDLF